MTRDYRRLLGCTAGAAGFGLVLCAVSKEFAAAVLCFSAGLLLLRAAVEALWPELSRPMLPGRQTEIAEQMRRLP